MTGNGFGRIRIIDFVGNAGGGTRFVSELLPAMLEAADGLEVEVVARPSTCRWYEERFKAYKGVGTREWTKGLNFPMRTAQSLNREAPVHRIARQGWSFNVPESLLGGADLVWFPWIHRHRLPRTDMGVPLVGSLHDIILLERPGLVKPRFRRAERRITERWLRSSARVLVSSETTIAKVATVFGVPAHRLELVPLSGEHAHSPLGQIPAQWGWARGPYLIMPANTFPHKNHELALAALALAESRVPLVLTGPGTDLPPHGRGAELRRFAMERGLHVGRDIIPLGMLDEGTYGAVLQNATALIMPTLGEGGGSFPVWEALVAGVPVACSDIPVLREQVRRTGARVDFFDPLDASALARLLDEICGEPLFRLQRAKEQVGNLRRRGWGDVADEYLQIFRQACDENEMTRRRM